MKKYSLHSWIVAIVKIEKFEILSKIKFLENNL